VLLREGLYVLGNSIPDLGSFQHAAENAGFHVHRPAGYAGGQACLLVAGNIFGFEAK
jgi:hypothetical protein